MTEVIANWCKRNKCFLIHYSTDYLDNYNYNSKKPITEAQDTCPINIYGKTKAQGDIAIKKVDVTQ